MTEPIKLPLRDAIIEGMGWPALKGHIAQDDDLICRIERVVEQATADLRAANEALGKRQEWWNESLFRVQQALDKALAERDDLQVALRTSQSAACKIIERLQAERDEARATLERCREVNDATAEGWRKTQIELAESRAELARLTTLRPHTGHNNTGLALWRFASGAATVSRKAQAGSVGWTPLPPVKEAP